ncbi:Rieske 2Fe-2S domain-containing protein [Marinobacter sp. TBZ242]|uniref:Rieske 2Fe-2S domain-containing protein n=1 Tax=Marinobacter azerbaijanicus TaxID=3050455 RepID=A0ABT7IE78_9GAMM|nr:Rieske 2Fe-2S domain-containing protein [Marinobacter sp. TBZ242]MDL0432473.1 Rieske 2Fe-2S domain-containing protein [Marinobacter sp. TBZ242]
MTRHWQTVCEHADLAQGRFVEFSLTDDTGAEGEQSGFAFEREGRLYAYLNRCPHLGIELNWMPGRFMDLDNCFIQCANHAALFIPENGQCIAGPCQGDALTPLEVTEDGGAILVRAPE